MYSECGTKLSASSVFRVLLWLIACTLSLTVGFGRTQMEKGSADASIRQRIETLMSETLAVREKLTPEGTRLWVPIPPSQEALQEVKGYGERALPALLVYLRSGAYQERELAMEFLGHIGGGRTLDGFLMVLRHDPDPRLRVRALTYVSELPWDIASPVLKEASKADSDPQVREQAEYILESLNARNLTSMSKGGIRKRIAAMIRHTLKKGEGVLSDGATLWMPRLARPSKEDIEEIRRYGDDAVPVLSKYLNSKDDREKILALQLLAALGGDRIVGPLEGVIQSDSSPYVRQEALKSLIEAPWHLARPLVERAAQSDPDRRVRQTALELLASRKPL